MRIDGMTCGHCVMSIKKELSKIPALNIKEVKIGSAVIETEESAAVEEKLSRAVEEAGYIVTSIQ
ncbi:MAG: heavy-metal-associated domain-containing protein [Bacteroidota bacterium]